MGLVETVSPEINCTICLNNDLEENNLCLTNCSHKFCKKCLDEWFDLGKVSCPICRDTIQYFNHQGESNRVIKIPSSIRRNNNNDNNNDNIVNMKMKYYKILSYIMIIINLYEVAVFTEQNNKINMINHNYNDCIENLTRVEEYNSELLSEINSGDYINGITPLTQISVVHNGGIYGCLMPISYFYKCFGS